MKTMRSLLIGVAMATAILPAIAQQPAKCQLAKIAEWPVRFVGNNPVIDGAINGKKITILLDTGSYVSLVMKASAEKLGLNLRGTGQFAGGFGGSTPIFVTNIEEMRIGESVRKNWRVRVAGEGAPPFDFILGDDFFRQVDLEFDYAKGVVRVFQPENCKSAFLGYWDANAQVLPMLNDKQHVVVPIKINGREGRATLDSGAAGSLVSLAFAESVGITKDSPGVLPGGCSSGMGGTGLRNWVSRFDSVSIGNETIRDPMLRIQDYSTTDMRQASDMFLGTDFLKSHRVYIARSQDKVYFSYTGGQAFTATPGVDCDKREADKGTPELLASYQQALAANPNDTKTLMQRADLRRRTGDSPGAMADLDAVIKLEPTNGVALAMRASMRAQAKDIDGSLADSEAAIAQGIRMAPMYANRGAMYRSKGNCERAIVEYEEALKIDPNLQSALRGRDACRKGEAKNE
ncbi:hypothetical protein DSM104443_00561 [Usitatibacter rugosus]|uniref:Uncharacterized protein n=1 Tax=Usitatibacter rugosus TaxID=2732067 RepID=A0A6M4GV52_9PROT|nr:retroviral-like aspartic protease family protein [Usitatibacter rugosus]QJR09517.1 hypothetical protein DSM104443_00561 [Usitatibacter rugosus]